jgi:hypothetical protein
MKPLHKIIVVVFFLVSGCAIRPGVEGPEVVIEDPEVILVEEKCTIYEEFGANPSNSLIAAKIPDPCRAKRLIRIVAKSGVVIWKKEYADKFRYWTDYVKKRIEMKISYADLQDLVTAKVYQLNIEAGLTLMVVGPEILQFHEVGILKDKDAEMMIALINELQNEVERMTILLE